MSLVCSVLLFRKRKIKFAYIGISVAFNAILTWILLK
jgi:hypothetical protein